jgi:Fur family peroxide stress response transcriptional regulator
MQINEIRNRLSDKGLKVTPQRIAILEAIFKLNNHPTAENIIDFIRKNNPNIATATVYKVLDALLENDLIKKVKTDADIMRYDAIVEKHHHIYSSDSDRIEDYRDEELDEMIAKHFERKKIADFKIEDIKVQIIGKFIEEKNSSKQ